MKVAVLMGSPNDRDKMAPAADTLARFGIEADVRVLSAHRNPDRVVELVSRAREDGYVAFICGAVITSPDVCVAARPPRSMSRLAALSGSMLATPI